MTTLAISLALTMRAKSARLAIVRHRLDAEYADKFGGAL